MYLSIYHLFIISHLSFMYHLSINHLCVYLYQCRSELKKLFQKIMAEGITFFHSLTLICPHTGSCLQHQFPSWWHYFGRPWDLPEVEAGGNSSAEAVLWRWYLMLVLTGLSACLSAAMATSSSPRPNPTMSFTMLSLPWWTETLQNHELK